MIACRPQQPAADGVIDIPEAEAVTLPHARLQKVWVPLDDERVAPHLFELKAAHAACCAAPGWNPKTIRLAGDWRATDYCSAPGSANLSGVELTLVADHPFLSVLKSFRAVPRVVKSLYRSDVLLAFSRASDLWAEQFQRAKADQAWAAWLQALPLPEYLAVSARVEAFRERARP